MWKKDQHMSDKYWKSPLFWRTYLLNLFLLVVAFSAFLFSAKAILPKIDQQKSKSVTEEAADRISSQISVIISELNLIASQIQGTDSYRYLSDDPYQLVKSIKNIADHTFIIDDVLVMNKHKQVIAVYPDSNRRLIGVNGGEYPYVNQSFSTKQIVYSDVFKSITGHCVIVVGIPIFGPDHEVERLIALRIRLTENKVMQQFFQALHLGEGGYVYIVDRKGYLISHPDKNRIGEDVHQNPVIQKIMEHQSGYAKVVNTKGIPMYASYRYIPDLQWGVIAQVSEESTLTSLHELENKVWKIALLMLIPFMLAIGLYTKKMVEPLLELYVAVDEVAKGNYEHHIDAKGNTEIGQLSKRFNELIEHIRSGRLRLQEKSRQLEQQQIFLRQVIDMNPSLIFARDREGRYTLANQSLADLYGMTIDQIIGRTEYDFNSNRQEVDGYLKEDLYVMETGKEQFFPEQFSIDCNGRNRWLQVIKIPIHSEAGSINQVLSIATDITERKEKERTIQYQANHDSLTQLPNRSYFQDKLNEAIEEVKGLNMSFAVMFLDLDHFKHINDNLGHDVGDRLLQLVSRRLKECISSHFIARMGGDEFTVLVSKFHHIVEVEDIAERILQTFKEPFWVNEMELHVTPSVGISVYPWDGLEAESLLKNADIAMYQAKKEGKNRYQRYTPDMSQVSWERLRIENHLRKSLVRKEFSLEYQPKQDLRTGKITGVEALLRWENRTMGKVGPDKFIPIAEETGMIISIGEWVIREACAQNKSWQDAGYPSMRMAVNVSVKQLMDPLFMERLEGILLFTGLAPDWLELEITESTLMANAEIVTTVLQQLREMGVRLSIDDFGTGYSSLNYLKRFPIDTIKIDRSFIQDLPEDEENLAITRAVLAISRSLKRKVIAEGVETKQQYSLLKAEGCDEVQGYLISKPVSTEEFERLFMNKFEKETM